MVLNNLFGYCMEKCTRLESILEKGAQRGPLRGFGVTEGPFCNFAVIKGLSGVCESIISD